MQYQRYLGFFHARGLVKERGKKKKKPHKKYQTTQTVRLEFVSSWNIAWEGKKGEEKKSEQISAVMNCFH